MRTQREAAKNCNEAKNPPSLAELFELFASLSPEYQAEAIRGVSAILQAEQGGAA